jgi:hypothetical protein
VKVRMAIHTGNDGVATKLHWEEGCFAPIVPDWDASFLFFSNLYFNSPMA